jgi:hypothetical protein
MTSASLFVVTDYLVYSVLKNLPCIRLRRHDNAMAEGEYKLTANGRFIYFDEGM